MDLTHLTPDEKINGIGSLKVPNYLRKKVYGQDVRETMAQLAEMIIQLGVNLSLDPDEALEWARKLQQALPQSEFDSWVATLLDGGPSIFMNTLGELKTTYPKGAAGVALVRETDPAKIYVWNGTAWEDFGDYQGIEIKDGTVTFEKLSKNLQADIDLSVPFTEGKYINFSGDMVSHGSYRYSDIFKLFKGEKIIFKNIVNTANNALVSKYDDNGVFKSSPLQVTSNNNADYTYTATETVENLRISHHMNSLTSISVAKTGAYTTNLINYINSNSVDYVDSVSTFIQPNVTTGYYISANGSKVTHGAFQYSDIFKLSKGETLNIYGVNNTQNVALISKYTDAGVFISAPIVVSVSTNKDYTYTPTDPIENIRISYFTESKPKITISRNSDYTTQIVNHFDSEKIKDDYKHLVKDVIAIGDSLTDGGYYTNGYTGSPIKENYPYYLGKITDWSVTEAGTTGYTSSDWWHANNAEYNFANYDTAIIWLGTNKGLTDTLVKDTTITDGQTYLDYANTHTGNYCKIIEKALSENPDIKLHLVKVNDADGVGVATTNKVISQIANKYGGLQVIDLTHLKSGIVENSSVIHPENDVHFGKIGNIRIARSIYEQVLQDISDNLSAYEIVLIE